MCGIILRTVLAIHGQVSWVLADRWEATTTLFAGGNEDLFKVLLLSCVYISSHACFHSIILSNTTCFTGGTKQTQYLLPGCYNCISRRWYCILY